MVAILISVFSVFISAVTLSVNWFNTRNSLASHDLLLTHQLHYNFDDEYHDFLKKSGKKPSICSVSDYNTLLKSGKNHSIASENKELKYMPEIELIILSGKVSTVELIVFDEKEDIFFIQTVQNAKQQIYKNKESKIILFNNVYAKRYAEINEKAFGYFYLVRGSGNRNYLYMIYGSGNYTDMNDCIQVLDNLLSLSKNSIFHLLPSQIYQDYQKVKEKLEKQGIEIS